MFDFALFEREASELQRPVLYVYRTGIWRRPMREYLLKTSLASGAEVVAPDAVGSRLILRTGRPVFFPNQKYILDLGDELGPGALVALRRSIDDEDPYFIGIMIDRTSGVLQDDDWVDVRALFTVAEEPLVTSQTLVPLLRFLERRTDLDHDLDAVSKPGFVDRFADLGKRGAELPELLHTFDAVVAGSETGAQSFCRDDVGPSDEVRIRGPLAGLIRSPTREHAISFVQSFDRLWSTGTEASALLRCLLQSTMTECRTVLRQTSKTRSASVHLELAVKWTALLLASSSDLDVMSRRTFGNKPQPAVVAVERLARNYVVKRPGSDPLAGRWTKLAGAIEQTDDVDGSRVSRSWRSLRKVLVDLVDALPPEGDSPWRQRLRANLKSPPATRRLLVGQYTAVANETRPRSVPSWSDILGQDALIKVLKTRVIRREHGATLILYGPRGVGKRTIAAAYAKAALCADPVQGSACNVCEPCVWFDKGGAWGYGNGLDASRPDAADQFTNLVAQQRFSSLAAHTFLIIRGAERMRPRVFDILLKVLETPWPRTTFVFLTESLSDFPLAGLSRAQALPVMPLGLEDAARFLKSKLRAAVEPDQDVLELLARSGRGLPAQLQRLAKLFAETPSIEAGHVRHALGLEWTFHVNGILPELLADFDAGPPGYPTVAISKRTRARALEVLVEIYLRRSTSEFSYSPSIAMTWWAKDRRMSMVSAFEKTARLLGWHPTEFWEKIAEAIDTD